MNVRFYQIGLARGVYLTKQANRHSEERSDEESPSAQ